MARSRPSPSTQGKSRRPAGLPSAADIVAFIRENPSAVGKREIARAFAVPAADRPALRDVLRQIERSGAVTRAANRRLVGGTPLPKVTVVERIGADEDGVPLARPVAWPGPDPGPILRLADEAGDALPIGARAAARLVALEPGEIEARVLRRLDRGGDRVVGVFRHDRDGGRVTPTDRRNKTEYRVALSAAAAAAEGELVVAEALPAARLGTPRARIVERLGAPDAPGAISLLAIASFELPTEFSAAAWAEAEPDPANAGGWRLVVAIADVAWYVRPGSALDREAERRGNSVYFPDRVVPMLPEALSNELCSLKPAVDRACLAVDLVIDAAGRKRRHCFVRAVMRSAARLTYEEIQAARDGQGELPASVPPATVTALYGAYAALTRARAARGALELDIREDRVLLDAERRPVAVVPAVRLDSHRLIEEFMILANVAAAEELEARHQPCMYRIHDAPDPEKVAALRDFLEELGIPGLAFAKGQAPTPELFNRLLRRAEASPAAALVNELVLRCQAQAAYGPDNIGHFGLGLRRYAHFTSPIRRYADLLVHRALISGQRFGSDGLPHPHEDFKAVGTHISMTERRAAAAERSAADRYTAAYLAERVGAEFAGRINGVTRAGLFVTLDETGADGLIPIRTLPDDYYVHDEASHSLKGRRSGRTYMLGDPVRVRLAEADAVTGSLLFAIIEDSTRTRGEPKRRRR